MKHYSYKFRLYPNQDQRNRLEKHFGACRYVYNHFLERRNKLYKETGKGSTYNQDSAELTKLKKSLLWMKEINAQSLQQTLQNLDSAFIGFFKKKSKFPKFHSKHKNKSTFKIPQSVLIVDKLLSIRKFREGIQLEQHRSIEGKIKSAIITKNRSNQYFVSILVERDIQQLPKVDKEIGIDLGITTLATCSDGKIYPNIKPYRMLEKRLKRLQRSHSRKKKGSKNREKARLKLARLYQRVGNIRSNHIHQMTSRIIRENQTIYIEDLNVAGMMKNHKLAKSIGDVSFYEIIQQLTYKADWYNRTLVKINRWFPSSKTCANCGHIKQNLTLADREWDCSQCKLHIHRDPNSSQMILQEGRRELSRILNRSTTAGTAGLACGEDVRPKLSHKRRQTSLKQEITSAIYQEVAR